MLSIEPSPTTLALGQVLSLGLLRLHVLYPYGRIWP